MLPRRLSLFLAITLIFPVNQAVNAQRDMDAEETVALNFMRLRRDAALPATMRVEGAGFARVACAAARHGEEGKVSVEGANYAATIYSTAKPEQTDSIMEFANRRWRADQRLAVGACAAKTPEFPAGRYWVAIGMLSNGSEREVAKLLSGGPAIGSSAGE